MIDRIVLNIPHSSADFPSGAKPGRDMDVQIQRWTDWYTGYLFGTAAMADPRIRPVIFPWSRFFCDVAKPEENEYNLTYLEHKARVIQELTPASLLIDCHSFPSDLSDVEVCIGVNADWSQPDKDMLDLVFRHFSGRGYKVAFNTPYSRSYAPEMPFRYPSLMIDLNKSTYLDRAGNLDNSKADKMKLAIEQLFNAVLRPWLEEIFRENLRLFYENREKIWANPRMASALTGRRNFNAPITLGGYLAAIEARPDLFVHKGSLVINYAGSMFSGACSCSLMNLKTGKLTSWEEGSFHSRRRAMEEAHARFPENDGALPLSVVAEILKKG